MDNGTDAGGFEIEEPGDGDNSSDVTLGGEIEEWSPIGRDLQEFDIQEPADNLSSDSIVAGDIEDWVKFRKEKNRSKFAYWIMMLYTAWLFIGLIVFLVLGNVWLLTSLGVLTIPLTKVCNYYFCR